MSNTVPTQPQYTAMQLAGGECALCGIDLAYVDGQRPHTTAEGLSLSACSPACPIPAVVLEETQLEDGVHVVYRASLGRSGMLRAAYDPRQVDAARAEALLRVSLGLRWERPVHVVISVAGELHLVPLPQGDPLRVVQLNDGRTRFELDPDQVPADEALRLLREVQAAKGNKAPECGARKHGWENGPAVGRHRIPCVRPDGHPGQHRDGLGQTWAEAAK